MNSPWFCLSFKDWASALFSWPSRSFAHLHGPLWSFHACVSVWITSSDSDNFQDWASISEPGLSYDYASFQTFEGSCWPLPVCRLLGSLGITMPWPLAWATHLIAPWCDFLPGNSSKYLHPSGRWARFLGPELYQPDPSVSFQVAFPTVELVESRDAWASF